MIIKQREILLVPFPFSDFSGNKVRPVLVISKDSFNASSDDIIVCGITSNITHNIYSILITTKDLEEGILYEQSCIKVENILKIEKRFIIKKIGKIKSNIFLLVLNKVESLFK